MNYVNPIDLLSLQDTAVADIDDAIIRKAKRKLYADIELSDSGSIEYKGHEITRSAADKAIHELEDREKLEFYHFISNYPELNLFLWNGNKQLFLSFRQESIYRLPSFVAFISPYFRDMYDKALLNAYQGTQIKTLQAITAVKPLVSAGDLDRTYKSVFNLVNEQLKQVNLIRKNLKEEGVSFYSDDLDELLPEIADEVNLNFLNALPAYFQNCRNQLALSVRNISVEVYNTYRNAKVSRDVLRLALQIETDAVTRERLKEDQSTIQELHKQDEADKRNEELVSTYAALIKSIEQKLKDIQNGATTSINVIQWVTAKISVAHINELDDHFVLIKNEVAAGMAAIAVAVWNRFHDIDTAVVLINIANVIHADTATRSQIGNVRAKLLDTQRQMQQKTQAPTPSTTDDDDDSFRRGCGMILLAGLIFLVMYILGHL